MSTKSTTKVSTLSEFLKKHLADRSKKLDKQPSAMTNGGLDKIIKDTVASLSPQTPTLKKVALVTVLNKCGSRPTEADLAVK